MKSNFDACLAHILRHEGGYVDHPNDPGGETNFGISKRAYPGENIKGMTRARAAHLYRRDYWDAVRGDDLPAGLDLVAFDAAVNSGVSRGAKWVQQAVGAQPDGKVGSATLLRVKATNPASAIEKACDLRMAFLRGLGTWSTFGKGWSRRVTEVRMAALGMSGAGPVPVIDAQPATPTTNPIAALFAWLSRLFGAKQ